jgi:sulfoacetaldehyde dehydrogenase
MWPDGKHLNRDIVARPATVIAKNAGLTVPDDTRFLMVIGEKVGPEDRFSGEKISPVLTVWKWTDYRRDAGPPGKDPQVFRGRPFGVPALRK